jgi:hypothetical protein
LAGRNITLTHTAGKYTGKTDTFVELKTSLVIRGPQDEVRFEKCVPSLPTQVVYIVPYADAEYIRKLLKFYMQSFLLGVPVRSPFPSSRLGILFSLTLILFISSYFAQICN